VLFASPRPSLLSSGSSRTGNCSDKPCHAPIRARVLKLAARSAKQQIRKHRKPNRGCCGSGWFGLWQPARRSSLNLWVGRSCPVFEARQFDCRVSKTGHDLPTATHKSSMEGPLPWVEAVVASLDHDPSVSELQE